MFKRISYYSNPQASLFFPYFVDTLGMCFLISVLHEPKTS
jgi:hypothetical protein